MIMLTLIHNRIFILITHKIILGKTKLMDMQKMNAVASSYIQLLQKTYKI